MNRHTRRAAAKRSTSGDESVTTAPAMGSAGAPQPPSMGLRLFARLLLADWVLKRVQHPDVVRILLQVAHQVGRSDAVARLTATLQSTPH